MSQGKWRNQYSLGAVYARVLGSGTSHAAAHSAEGDCLAMLQLVKHFGVPALEYLDLRATRYLHKCAPMYRPLSDQPLPPNMFPYEAPTGDLISD